jgi:hypothetical protein
MNSNASDGYTLRPVKITPLIRDFLRAKPSAKPADVSQWLSQSGFNVSPEVVSSLLAAIKVG